MLRQTEEVYPIHVAAKHGNHLMIRLLCSEGLVDLGIWWFQCFFGGRKGVIDFGSIDI